MKKALFGLFLILGISLYAVAPYNPNLYSQVATDPKMKQWVDSVYDAMTLEERIAQLVILAVETQDTETNRALIRKYITEYKIGGLLFTSGSATTQARLTNYAQSLAKTPLLITMDGEWGLAMRLKDTPRFPKNMTLGAIDNDSLIYEYGKEVGRQCRRMGIHVNFAPVLDVNSNAANPVIGTRAFGEDPKSVARKGIMYAKGIESEGILTTAKHFPGHGDTSADSHYSLPVITHSQDRLNEFELFPFQQYIAEGLSGIMVGHLAVPTLDKSGTAASLSPLIIDSLLRQKMGFNGIVFTDALEMKGVSNQTGNAEQVLLAGNDVLLKPAAPQNQIKRLTEAAINGSFPIQLIEEKCIKILQYKYLCGLNQYKPVEQKNLIEDLNSLNSTLLIERINNKAVTLLNNDSNRIPFKNLEKQRIAIISIGEDEVTSFQQTMELYVATHNFAITRKTPAIERKKIIDELKHYNRIILAIYSKNENYLPIIREFGRNVKPTYVFFTDPYLMLDLKSEVKRGKGIVMGYENTAGTQQAAAQLLFGGIEAQGKLPVSLKGLYAAGAGIQTAATRLGYSQPEATGMRSSALNEIEKIVNEGIEKRAFPGCQVLVAHKGKVVYNQSFGYFDYANTKAVTNDDIYDLASVSKTTGTLAAIMHLVSTGKIKLDEPLSKYIPELKETDKANITFYDALFHESGMIPSLPMYDLLVDPNSYSGSLFKNKRDATYRLQIGEKSYVNQNMRLRRDLISSVKSPEYPVPVGENMFGHKTIQDTIFNRIVATKRLNKKYRYSCLNFIMLRKVVENRNNERMDRVLTNHFYAPLGARHTTYNPLARGFDPNSIAPTENDMALRRQILIGYTHDETAAFGGGVEGNAGLFSNANDLAKLLQLYLNGGKYGDREYIKPEIMKQFTTQTSQISRRGLGFDKPDGEGYPCPEAPKSVYGHTGYTGTCFWIDPDNEMIFIFLSNRVYPHRWYNNLFSLNIRTRILTAIYEAMK